MSDHISGPRALADPIADITDVYAFPSPERPGRLVLVMNTLPLRQALRPLLGRAALPLPAPAAHAAAGRRPAGRSSPGEDEVVIDCVFGAPEHVRTRSRAAGHEQHGTCTTPSGETVSFRVNDEDGRRRRTGSGSSPVSAGTRSSWTPARP